jgi:hypothetical protein
LGLTVGAILTALVLCGPVSAWAQVVAARGDLPSASSPAYPLKVSNNRRYLVDRNNKPFLIVGDTPQGLMSRLSETEIEMYFSDRQAHGFNSLGWIDVACAGRDYPSDIDGSTYDGIRPFTGFLSGGTDYAHYDLAKPNEAYFDRLDHVIRLASKHGLLVFINPMETAGWLPTLRNNGPAAAYNYGEYLGRRYRGFPNIAWLSGNDFQSWRDANDDALVQAVARGIKSVDPDHIQTVELNYQTSSSFDDPTWIPIIDINGTYTYSPTYFQMLHSYNQTPIAPTFLMEAHYELDGTFGIPADFGTPQVLRREEYWTMLSGGKGQFYGSAFTWGFKSGWQTNLDTVGVTQLTIWKKFFSSLPWQDLVPDQEQSIVTDGLGSVGDLSTPVSKSEFTTASRTVDGSFIVAYMPTARTITVNMTSLKGRADAKWFDPTNGAYITVPGGPFAHKGTRKFTPRPHNHDGDSDWVLLLNASGSKP